MSQINKAEEEKSSIQNPRITWEGCSVLLDINDGDRLVFSRLTSGSVVKIGNKNCSLKPLIGCAFGSLFQVENGNKGPYLSRVLPTTEGDNIEETTSSLTKDELKDNRELVDNNTAQSLTGEDIDALRRQGASGDEIVEALIANSATFEKKTSFSQEKYRLKKQKKYAPKVLLRRPFARSICETYFKKYPERIGFLRVDTLSLLLSFANVTAHSDVLLVDMTGGMITGAVAERLGGTGYVCNTHLGETPYPVEIVRIFNFSDDICKRIVQSSLSALSGGQNGSSQQSRMVEDPSGALSGGQNGSSQQSRMVEDPSGNENQTNEEPLSLNSSLSVSMDETTTPNENVVMKLNNETTALKACKAAKAGEKAPQEAIKMWRENGFSSLIIAAPDMDAWSIIKEVLPLLSCSAPFAIYHQYLQPLATCMHNLQLERMAIGLQITEPWLREYQVLPSRSHPHMQMSSFGGYILSGTRISSGGADQ